MRVSDKALFGLQWLLKYLANPKEIESMSVRRSNFLPGRLY